MPLRKRSKCPTPQKPVQIATGVRGELYVLCNDGVIYAVDAQDGSVWEEVVGPWMPNLKEAFNDEGLPRG